MMTRLVRSLSLGLLLSALSAGVAHAIPIALELETGTGIPLGAFPDGVPVSVDDPNGDLYARIPNSSYNVLLDANPIAGLNVALSLLLGNWYLRSAVSVNTYSSVTATRYAVTRVAGQDLEDLENIYVGQIDEETELDETSTIVMARFGFGYRWYLLPEGLARPYIPMGFGGVMAMIEDEARGGVTFHFGLGVDIHIHEHFDLGLKVVYEWMGVFLPENFQASSAGAAIGAAATSENSVLEAFMESLHTLQLGATATVRF